MRRSNAKRFLQAIVLCLILFLSSISISLTSASEGQDKYSTSIFGIGQYQDGIDADGASAHITSTHGTLVTYLGDEGAWTISCDWPIGTEFDLLIIGCCSHRGWRVSGTFTLQVGGTDTGTLILLPNNAPNPPTTPSGPTESTVGRTETFFTQSSEPDGDKVSYRLSLDGADRYSVTDWTDLSDPDLSVGVQATFRAPGTYIIKSQAIDKYGKISTWSSTGLEVEVTGTNYPPNIMSLDGPSILELNSSGMFSVSAVDPEGSNVRYRFDWGDSNITEWSSYMQSGENWSAPHCWNVSGLFGVRAQSMDVFEQTSAWSTPLYVVVAGENEGPATPIIGGDASGRVNEPLGFFINGSDPDDSHLYFFVDWGDGSNSGWIGPFPIENNIDVTHSFTSAGSYQIRVKSQDSTENESNWSNLHSVQIFNGPQVVLSEGFVGESIIEFVISNEGDLLSEEIEWEISIEGGFFFGERMLSGSIQSLNESESYSATTSSLFGIGSLSITIEVLDVEAGELSSSVETFLFLDRFWDLPFLS